MKYLILLLMLSPICVADSYSIYNKVSLGYILQQPDSIHIEKGGYKQDLYTGDNVGYTLERGIIVDNYRFGMSWSDLLNQQGNKDAHRPYKLEVFGDHYWRFKYFDIKVGTGIKLFEQREVSVYNGDTLVGTYDQYRGFGKLQDRFTARFSVTKQIGNYEIGIGHNSQWFVGQPVNDNFEYHKTEIVISYIF